MEALALYLIKSTVWLTGFALVYLLFLRNERFFVLNRIYLISGIIVSIVFPLFTWHYTVVLPNAPTIEVSDLQMLGTADIPEPFPTQAILLYIYLAGVIYLLYRVIRQTRTVLRVIRKSEILHYRSAKLIRTTDYPASFSFFSFVFVNPSTCDTETNEIVNHEMEHIRQQHWIDLLLFEILLTIQWFNPVSWLYGRFIRQNHEYLADERALQRTNNPGIYRAALLNQMFGGPVISLANSFNYSLNKKRFTMMKQTINSPIRKFKLLLVLPLIAGVFYAFATPDYKYSKAENNAVQEEVLTKLDTNSPGSVTTLNSNFVTHASKDTTALYFIDGQESTKAEVDQLNPDIIESVSVLKGEKAISKYGEKGKNGVVFISKKKGAVESVNVNSLTSQIFKVQTNASLKLGNADGSNAQPLIVKDGVIAVNQNVDNIPPETIESINVLKGEQATSKFGDKGKNGVVEITIKKEPYSFKNEPIDRKVNGFGIAQKENTKKESEPYTVVEQMPTFPGGEEALRAFIAANIRYPASAHEKGTQGKVYINFVVTKTGNVANAKVVRGVDQSLDQEVTVTSGARPSQSVVRGVDPSLDQEAIRVITLMPTWKPGMQNGKNVDVEYTIPINFVLEKVPEKETKSTIDQTIEKHELIIVPNPTNDKAMITLKGSNSKNELEVSVYDSYGKLIMKESKNGPTFTISVAKLTTGTYLVVANDGTKQFQGHLVVNH